MVDILGLHEAPKIDVGEVDVAGCWEADRGAGRWMLFLEDQEMVNRDMGLGALFRWENPPLTSEKKLDK